MTRRLQGNGSRCGRRTRSEVKPDPGTYSDMIVVFLSLALALLLIPTGLQWWRTGVQHRLSGRGNRSRIVRRYEPDEAAAMTDLHDRLSRPAVDTGPETEPPSDRAIKEDKATVVEVHQIGPNAGHSVRDAAEITERTLKLAE
jgi:hypothetical protein